MNKKIKFSLLILSIIAALVAVFYFLNTRANKLPIAKPQVEIVHPKVFAGEQELKNGDELEIGSEIKTNPLGKANIHFANGSIASLEPNSTLIIKQSSFDPQNNDFIINLFLKSGEVISKVAELATPESSWEVKTPNAVAVVRGTKYSVKYDREKSLIEVFENSVLVAVIDPKTGEIIEGTVIILNAGNFTEIDGNSVRLRKQPNIFEALLIFSNGASRNVTEEVEWEISDEEKDSIGAIWRNPTTGQELKGKIKVN